MSAEINTQKDNTTVIKLKPSNDDSICNVNQKKEKNSFDECRFKSIHPIRKAPEYSVKELCQINSSLFVALGFFPPFIGAFSSILMALVFHYDLISNYNWQCGRARFPSISRIINLPLERIPWQMFVLFHVPFRVIELCVGNVRYKRLMSTHCTWPKFYNFSRICYTTFGFLEVIFLVFLSVIGERENIGVHVIFFYLMGFCGFVFYIANIICHSQSLWYLNPYGRISYYIKIITTCLYFISMPILFTAFYLYWKKCITVMYDVFALTEYTDFLLNIIYHCCAFLDIRHKVIFSIRNVKPADKLLLNPRHKNIAEGKINPIQYDWEKEVSVLRERFGTYGLASNVNLSQLWPTIEEIQEIQACNLYSPYKEVLEAAKKCEEEKQKELENKLKEVEENDKKYSETTVQN